MLPSNCVTVMTFTLGELAEALGCELRGDASRLIAGLSTLDSASAQQLTFLANDQYRRLLAETQAAAVILSPGHADQCPVDCLITERPYVAFAKATHLFSTAPKPLPEIHPSAHIAEDVTIGAGVSIGPNVVVESGVVLGDRVVLGANVVVAAGASIGSDSRLYSNVTIYHGVTIGQRCIIHSGAVIGADGFGFAREAGNWLKIAQLGGVRIEDDVEVGANTTIDRGALEDTVIERGAKIDNLVMIAHNCRIGQNTAIAGCTGIAGSSKIGANCTLAGGVGLVGHLEIADNVHVTGMTMVTKSITEPGSYSAGTPMSTSGEWRKSAARFNQLDSMYKRIVALEKALAALQGGDDNN